MKRIKLCLTALGVMIALAATSCHKSADQVAAVVPVQSATIMAVDAGLIIDNAGGKYSADGIELPSVLSKYVGEDAMAKLAALKGVDIKNMYFFGEMSGNGALVAPVTDKDAITSFLADNGLESTELKGYTVFSEGGNSLLIKDNILWFTGMRAESAVEYVEQSRKSAASDGSLADSDWRMAYFAESHAVAVLINFSKMPFIAQQLTAQYSDDMPGAEKLKALAQGSIALNCNLDGLTCISTYGAFDKDGKALSMSPEQYGMTSVDIDTDFLKYLTSNEVFVLAGGIPGNYPWENVLNAVAKQVGVSGQQVMMALPYLQALDGTIAFAAGPRNGIASFSGNNITDNWDGILYLTLKEGKAAEFFAQIKALAQMQLGDAVKAVGDDICISMNDITVYIGVRDKNLIASLHEITTQSGALFTADEFKNQPGIAMLRLAKDSALCTQLGMPFGVFSKINQKDENTAQWLIEQTSTEGKFIENIINYAALSFAQ